MTNQTSGGKEKKRNGKQKNREIYKQTYIRIDKSTNKQRDKQTKTILQANRQIDKQTNRHIQTSRRVDTLTNIQIYKKTTRQRDKQTNKHND